MATLICRKCSRLFHNRGRQSTRSRTNNLFNINWLKRTPIPKSCLKSARLNDKGHWNVLGSHNYWWSKKHQETIHFGWELGFLNIHHKCLATCIALWSWRSKYYHRKATIPLSASRCKYCKDSFWIFRINAPSERTSPKGGQPIQSHFFRWVILLLTRNIWATTLEWKSNKKSKGPPG